MVQLYLKGRVENVVKGRDFVNKESGEVRKGSLKLQFIAMDSVRGLKTIDVTVPEEYEHKAMALKGQDVDIPVDVFAKGSKLYYRVVEL